MPLLRAGAKISPRYPQLLVESGIHTVWVNDTISAGIEPVDLVPPHVREEAARTVTNALAASRDSIQNRQVLSPAVMSELSRIVEQIAAAVAGHSGAAL